MNRRWTLADLKRKGLISNVDEVTNSKKSVKIPTNAKKISIEIQSIKKILWVLHRENIIAECLEEHSFHPDRKWRFDFAIPELMIAIEYEGLMSEKSGHTTIKGYSKDCEKYNEAIKQGWKLLRYTALNYQNLHDDLIFLAKK